jgi:glycosyltransferase involved in cell wall biosynthesis
VNDKKVAVVVPFFNESKAIFTVIENLKRYQVFHLIFVDDGSEDDSFDKIVKTTNVCIKHPFNLGQGAALQTGFDYALSKGYEYIATFDADGQHSADDLWEMYKIISTSNNIEVLLGSRFISGAFTNASLVRRVVLKLAVLFTRLTIGLSVTDSHNGLRIMRRDVVRSFNLKQNRMAHASEILFYIKRNKFLFKEYPVSIIYTSYSVKKGQSLFGFFDILKDLFLRKF